MCKAFEDYRLEGERKLAKLLQKLIDDGRGEEVGRVLSDHEYRE